MGGDLIITGGMPLNGTVHIPAAKNSVLPLAGSGPFVQWHGAFSAGAASCGCGHQRGAFAGCGLHGPLAGQRHHGAGRAFHLPPCAGSRRADAGIHFVLRTASGTAWPGGNGAARRVPHWCKAGGPAPFRPCADGVHCREEGARLILTAPAGLHGADITLGFPSVGATETLLLAAAAAQGETVLRGAAREPEISDLAAFLNRCGGCVQGAGTSTIRVQGRRMLYSCSFAPMADRIVASTLACACAAAGGRVELTGCRPETYAPLLEILAQMGCRVETGPESAVITRLGALHGAGRVFTGVYPALATDAAPLLAAAMLAADSASSIEDVVFERRFGCAEGFAAFGAAVQVQGRTLDIRPVRQLQGACARAADLRGGAALVVAALAARGRSRITDTGYIDRGYAGFAQMLAELGAQIEREMPRESASEKKTPSKKQN